MADNTNGMPTFMGRGAGVDGNGVISDIAYYPNITAKTADYTVTIEENGTCFTTVGASGAVNFTLPAISEGPFIYYFFNAVGQNMVITAETAASAISFNNAAASTLTFSTASNLIGASALALCDGTSLFIINISEATGTVA